MTEDKSQEEKDARHELKLFVQGEGLGQIRLVKIDRKSTVADLIAEVTAQFGGEFVAAGGSGNMTVTLEDDDRELPAKASLEKAGVRDRSRVHIHRCRKVKVSVNFNGETGVENFPPSTTVGKVKKWAVKKLDIDKIDATEHALQLCGTANRPDEDVHIGTLTSNSTCSVCFDLVPKKRVEGASKK